MSKGKGQASAIFGIIGVFFFLVFAFSSFTTISAGEVGLLDTFGKVDERVYSPGFTWKNPLAKMVKYNMKTERITLNNVEASDISGQKVFADIVLNFRIKDRESARELYLKVGKPDDYWQILALDSKMAEGFKQTTVGYEALEILEKRNEVAGEAKENIRESFPTEYFEIEQINIVDIRYTESFDNAIQRKKDAEQLALASENEVKVSEAEAKKAIAKAEGDKQVAILDAEAKAESQRLLRETVTQDIIELRKIERDMKALDKWDGKLPDWITSGGELPFISVGSPTGGS